MHYIQLRELIKQFDKCENCPDDYKQVRDTYMQRNTVTKNLYNGYE